MVDPESKARAVLVDALVEARKAPGLNEVVVRENSELHADTILAYLAERGFLLREDLTEINWKRILMENGTIDADGEADHFGLKLLALSFAETLADAENYMSITIGVKPAGASSPINVFSAVVRPGHKNPHELRLEAEAEKDRLRGILQEIADGRLGDAQLLARSALGSPA